MDAELLFDTHCHLDRGHCPEGPEPLIARARRAGVGYFTVIGVGGIDSMRDAVALAETYDCVWATVGVHPNEASELDATTDACLRQLAAHPRVVAIGEMGLDYHYDRVSPEQQRAVFERQITIALESRKPVVVHTRSAASDTLDVLASSGVREVGGIIHCFSEDREFARRALDLGFDLSFSGIVTFKNAAAIHDVAAWAPLDRVLLETDSPYLAPVPLRGKPCEPAFVVHTARRIAELRGMPVSDLVRASTANAARRFRLNLAAVSGASEPVSHDAPP